MLDDSRHRVRFDGVAQGDAGRECGAQQCDAVGDLGPVVGEERRAPDPRRESFDVDAADLEVTSR